MKAGTYPAWQLLPGDILDDGVVVVDCVARDDGLVTLTLQLRDGTKENVRVPRAQMFSANQKGG